LDWLGTEPRPLPQEGVEESFEPQQGMFKERITKKTQDINIKGIIITYLIHGAESLRS
jgi:hypothetical protein